MMRNKEMTMTDSSDHEHMLMMYHEACIEENATMTHDGFMNFVAWRKRVEKYFDNNEDSS